MSVNYLDITNIGAMYYNTSLETYCFVDSSVLLHNKDWRNTATSEVAFVLVKFRKFSDPNRNLNSSLHLFVSLTTYFSDNLIIIKLELAFSSE